MVAYRRNRVAGGTYFFTVTLRDRRSSSLVEHIATLREAFRVVHRDKPYSLDAIVILPDHLHAVWTLPPGDADYSGRWRDIKARFTHSLRKAGANIHRNAAGEYDLWQKRFWEHTIRDETDLQRHVDYVHYNPVKHGLVERVAAWPHSSFHRHVRLGWLPLDWAGGGAQDDGGKFGE